MNKEIKPREYQKGCLAAIDEAIAKGAKRALVVMASSLGKTYTSAFAVEKFFADKPFGRVLILCHSEPILRQSKKKFKDYFGEEFSYGMYVDSDKTTRPTNFLFATFQTMKENRKNFPKDEFAYIIVDEAHHSKARTYFPTIRYFQSEFLLGLTATPDRLDGQKIEEIYGEPVYELGFVEATKRGLIAECDYRLVLDDLSQERLDEYLASDEKLSIKQLNRTLFINKRDEEIVRLIGEYSAEVKNPKTMIFCQTIAHARKIAQLMGDNAVLVHKENRDSANNHALRAFEDGEINAIISVNMLNEGVDIPDANVIVFLRNTVSPAVFYQQLGRGTRLSKDKEKALILDFVNNYERIEMVLELKQEIDDFRLYPPKTGGGGGGSDPQEKFTLNIATPEFKEKTIDIISMLENTARRWTREEILLGMQEMHRNGEKVCLTSVEANRNLPSSTTIIRLFGSFNNALREAEIPINRDFIVSCNREDVLAEGQAMTNRGEVISLVTIKNNPKLPSVSTICNLFGTINDFATLCGQYRKDRSRDTMLRQFWLESKAVSHWLNDKEIDTNEKLFGSSAYRTEFGQRKTLIAEAQAQFGLPYNEEEAEERNDALLKQKKECLAKQFYEASIRKGHWLRDRDFKSCNGVSSTRVYRQYFGGGIPAIINFTCALLGIAPDILPRLKKTAKLSDAEHVKRYWERSRNTGHWLTKYEVDQDTELESYSFYKHRLGGLVKMRQTAIKTHGDFTKETTATN